MVLVPATESAVQVAPGAVAEAAVAAADMLPAETATRGATAGGACRGSQRFSAEAPVAVVARMAADGGDTAGSGASIDGARW